MKKVSGLDLFEVRQLGYVSDIDNKTLIDFYQPLIGVSSIGLYNALLEDPSREDNSLSTFESLSIRTGLTLGELFSCFEALEAVGLVKSYVKEDSKISCFIFKTFSPLTPNEFINDVLLFATLKKQLGEKMSDKLVKKYALVDKESDYEEVSTTFAKYFTPDLSNESIFKGKSTLLKGHNSGVISTSFDFKLMSKCLADLHINESDFSKKEEEVISKLATLYLMDESQMSALVSLCFDHTNEIGNKLDISKLERECRSTFGSSYRRNKPTLSIKSDLSNTNSDNAELVKLMDSVSPAEFLAFKQNNTKPAISDLKIVEDLSLDLGLSYPVINALIDYVLKVNNNMLSKAYVEKIGAALSREGVKTSLDTLDYLYRVNNSYKTSKSTKKETKSKNNEVKEEIDEYSDAEVDALLKSLNNK